MPDRKQAVLELLSSWKGGEQIAPAVVAGLPPNANVFHLPDVHTFLPKNVNVRTQDRFMYGGHVLPMGAIYGLQGAWTSPNRTITLARELVETPKYAREILPNTLFHESGHAKITDLGLDDVLASRSMLEQFLRRENMMKSLAALAYGDSSDPMQSLVDEALGMTQSLRDIGKLIGYPSMSTDAPIEEYMTQLLADYATSASPIYELPAYRHLQNVSPNVGTQLMLLLLSNPYTGEKQRNMKSMNEAYIRRLARR